MTQITLDTSKGQLVPFYFGQDAVAASQTAVQIPAVMAEASQVNAGYTVPFSGEIVAISAMLSVAGTAGTFAIGPTIGGAADLDAQLTVGTATNPYVRVPRGKMPFVAGNEIGCEITTSAGWDAITADLQVTVWALVYLAGI